MGLHGIHSNDFSSVYNKLGCFKRKRPEDYEEEEDEAPSKAENPPLLAPAPTNGTVSQSETDQPSEGKTLLGDGEANGATPLPEKELELD